MTPQEKAEKLGDELCCPHANNIGLAASYCAICLKPIATALESARREGMEEAARIARKLCIHQNCKYSDLPYEHPNHPKDGIERCEIEDAIRTAAGRKAE